ncbi:MAG: Co2+/Mg2+ efflux protein ApaG [Gammaproteobacteria bacterium]|jgi:ApaG protein
MSSKNQIDIDVKTAFIPNQSEVDKQRYVFSYTVTIHNKGDEPARLLNRHWLITDANGKIQEVRGAGVVGEQPYLKPGESYQYTSGTILDTPVGSMQGEYEMTNDDGTRFLAPIEPFSLALPRSLH